MTLQLNSSTDRKVRTDASIAFAMGIETESTERTTREATNETNIACGLHFVLIDAEVSGAPNDIFSQILCSTILGYLECL